MFYNSPWPKSCISPAIWTHWISLSVISIGSS